MSLDTTLDRQKDVQEETNAEKNEREITYKIEKGIADCRRKLDDPMISAVTRTMYESMFEEIREKKEVKWAEDSAGDLGNIISNAKEYQVAFDTSLLSAKAKGWISEGSYKRWQDRFNDPSLLEWTRRNFVEKKFPTFVANWEKNANRRTALLKKFSGDVDAEDAPELAVLKSDSAFLELDYHEQKNLLGTLEAMDIATLKGKKKLFQQVRATLAQASTGEDRYLLPTKTGLFLKQMMNAAKPEQFRETVLEPSLTRLQETRGALDAFAQEAESRDAGDIGVPPLHVFLQWDVTKRMTSIEEGRRRLDAMEKDEQKEQDKDRLLSIKLVEKRMDIGDWDGADIFLADALSQYPDDEDLAVMQRYLEAHRTDPDEEDEEKTVADMTQEIDAMLEEIPFSARNMCVEALDGGSEQFGMVVESMYLGAQKPSRKKKDAEHALPALRIYDPERKADASAVTRRETREEEYEEADDAEGNGQEVVMKDDSSSTQRETLDSLMEEDLFNAAQPKSLTITDISAENQMLYHTQLYLPILERLRRLEKKGVNYRKAA